MSVTGIILAAVIVGGTGLFIGVFLGRNDCVKHLQFCLWSK